MTCEECERCRELGYRFCNKCGSNLSIEPVDPQDVQERKDSTLQKLVIPSMILITAAIIADVIFLLANLEGPWNWIYDRTISVYLYFIYEVQIGITGTAAQIYFIIMAACLVAAAAKVLYDSRDVFSLKEDYVEKAERTPVYWIALLFGTTIIIEMAMTLMVQSGGQEIVIPDWMAKMTFDEAVFAFTRAAVWEEIAFRAVLFGVPMMVAALILRQKDFYRYLFGGFGSSRIAVILLIATSVIFAYAHVGGWGLWKMVPTVLGGLAMGYLYMRFGIHVSIMFHCITDYMGLYAMSNLLTIEAFWLMCILFLALICYPILAKKTWKGLKKLKDMPWWGTGKKDQNDSNSD